MAIQRQPGTNTVELVDNIKAMMPHLEESIPPSVQVDLVSDRSLVVRAAVHDVQFTMMLTVGLVVLVIFLFLRTLWATVIPSMAVPMSLLATFSVMYAVGYSLDNISLMALTISVGFVVDDAIVMIENIVRYIEQGDRPFDAALKGAGQIGFTIISITFSLIAVFIPLLVHGRHHRPAVPRVRGHRIGRGRGLGVYFADPDAGAVLAVFERAGTASGRPHQSDGRAVLRRRC